MKKQKEKDTRRYAKRRDQVHSKQRVSNELRCLAGEIDWAGWISGALRGECNQERKEIYSVNNKDYKREHVQVFIRQRDLMIMRISRMDLTCMSERTRERGKSKIVDICYIWKRKTRRGRCCRDVRMNEDGKEKREMERNI